MLQPPRILTAHSSLLLPFLPTQKDNKESCQETPLNKFYLGMIRFSFYDLGFVHQDPIFDLFVEFLSKI
ncbi:hypothetical protein L6452_36637 [Arctium lappa]|uniref:Uncharacterized protein n=1 Tax=Arctium lappa TaxID=4217 RepID=A0ACB8YB85_ARCLA|nr:hypothetical protein L6452_36637 [Arctium lappa]